MRNKPKPLHRHISNIKGNRLVKTFVVNYLSEHNASYFTLLLQGNLRSDSGQCEKKLSKISRILLVSILIFAYIYIVLRLTFLSCYFAQRHRPAH